MARLFHSLSPGPLAATPVTAPAPRPRFSARPGVRRAALAVAVLLAVAAAHLAGNDAEFGARSPRPIPNWRGCSAPWRSSRRRWPPRRCGWPTACCADRSAPASPSASSLAAALMAAAPVLMWHVAHVGTGALLFHAAAILLLVLGWRPAEAWLSARSRERAR